MFVLEVPEAPCSIQLYANANTYDLKTGVWVCGLLNEYYLRTHNSHVFDQMLMELDYGFM